MERFITVFPIKFSELKESLGKLTLPHKQTLEQVLGKVHSADDYFSYVRCMAFIDKKRNAVARDAPLFVSELLNLLRYYSQNYSYSLAYIDSGNEHLLKQPNPEHLVLIREGLFLRKKIISRTEYNRLHNKAIVKPPGEMIPAPDFTDQYRPDFSLDKCILEFKSSEESRTLGGKVSCYDIPQKTQEHLFGLVDCIISKPDTFFLELTPVNKSKPKVQQVEVRPYAP